MYKRFVSVIDKPPEKMFEKKFVGAVMVAAVVPAFAPDKIFVRKKMFEKKFAAAVMVAAFVPVFGKVVAEAIVPVMAPVFVLTVA